MRTCRRHTLGRMGRSTQQVLQEGEIGLQTRGFRVRQRHGRRWGAGAWILWFGLMLSVGVVSGAGVGWWRGQDEAARSPVIALWRADEEQLALMDLEEYLVGVVAAEMPSSFHMEALKAQAVAARTYALRAMAQGRRVREHPEAVLSTVASAGQAWLSPEGLRQRWGERDFPRHWERIVRAVAETRGEVLVFEGQLIEALYHSTSGGHTENAHDYFRYSHPYLQGVPDPYSSHSPHHSRLIVMSRREVWEKLGLEPVMAQEGDGVPVASWPGESLQIVARTATGRVKTLRVGQREFSGREVRERLGLPSSWFQVEERGDQVFWTVRGNGHGVGMSQYGADGMARAGYDYRAILAHYYRGVRVARWY